jgi:hypothetical protein
MVRGPRSSVQGLAQRLEAIAEVHGSRTGGYCGTTKGLWSINQKQHSVILGPWSLAQGPKLLDRNFHPGVFSFGFCLCVKRQCGHHAAQPSTLHIAGQSSLAPGTADLGSRSLHNPTPGLLM